MCNSNYNEYNKIKKFLGLTRDIKTQDEMLRPKMSSFEQTKK